MSLQLRAVLPERGIDVDIRLEDGETVALLGPNGAGKSTLVSLIAGLLHPRNGRAELDGRVLFEVSGGRGTWLPAHRRGTALLAQEPLLFPHLSALDNVAFGPRSAGTGRKAATAAARHWLGETEADSLAAKRPAELSGGQAQRVALARALAAEPALLLLDEPMAALDVETVPAMRRLLRRVLAGRSALIVTHDVLDALTLADRVLVMQDGHVLESGPPGEVLRRPRTQFTASLAGLNLVPGGRIADSFVAAGFTLPGLFAQLPVPGRLGGPAGAAGRSGGEARWLAAFPPSSVLIHRTEPAGDKSPFLRGQVTDLEPQGDRIRVRAGGIAADIPPARAADLQLEPGQDVFLSLDAGSVELYPG